MARESFRDEGLAALLSEHFVPVKVDREERPDLDEIMIRAVQQMTGEAGWPLNVVLTPELEPFLGATYLPPYGIHGRPGLNDFLRGAALRWERDPGRERARAAEVVRAVGHVTAVRRSDDLAELGATLRARAAEAQVDLYDDEFGGLGGGSKFPRGADLRFALDRYRETGDERSLRVATGTLDALSRGAINDPLGGGIHRYTVDERWLVPHFEKHLADQATVSIAALEAFEVSHEERYASLASATLDWTCAALDASGDLFASSIDADSAPCDGGELEEGAFYTWSTEDLRELFGDVDAAFAADWFGIDEEGPLEGGRSAPSRMALIEDIAESHRLSVRDALERAERVRRTMIDDRGTRPRPALDNKVLTGANALTCSALAIGARILDREDWGVRAAATLEALDQRLRDVDGRLRATRARDVLGAAGNLEDYAFFVQAALDLMQTTRDSSHRTALLSLATRESRVIDELFEEGGALTQAPHDRRDLFTRVVEARDGAGPNPAATQAWNLVRIAGAERRAASPRTRRGAVSRTLGERP